MKGTSKKTSLLSLLAYTVNILHFTLSGNYGDVAVNPSVTQVQPTKDLEMIMFSLVGSTALSN